MQSLKSPRRLLSPTAQLMRPSDRRSRSWERESTRQSRPPRGMLEAEEALRLVRRRFEHTEDPELRESSQPRRSTTSNASCSSQASGVGNWIAPKRSCGPDRTASRAFSYTHEEVPGGTRVATRGERKRRNRPNEHRPVTFDTSHEGKRQRRERQHPASPHLDLSRPFLAAPRRQPASTVAFQAVHERERGSERAAQWKAIVEAVRRMLRGRAARGYRPDRLSAVAFRVAKRLLDLG